VQRIFFGVSNDERASEAEADLFAGQHVGMRMIEVQSGALADLKVVIIELAGSYPQKRAAIVLIVDDQSVPVRDRLFLQVVQQPYSDQSPVLAFQVSPGKLPL
jgi:hypothetical protein